jgi:hypothetical protein
MRAQNLGQNAVQNPAGAAARWMVELLEALMSCDDDNMSHTSQPFKLKLGIKIDFTTDLVL